MTDSQRLEAFERMLSDVRNRYREADDKMKHLKAQGKEKSATFRQMMGQKLQYQDMLILYRLYGLLDEEAPSDRL